MLTTALYSNSILIYRSKSPTKTSPPKFNHAFGNMIPAKVEVKMSGTYLEEQRNASKPIDIKQPSVVPNQQTNGSSFVSLKSEKRKCNQLRRLAHNSNTFDTPIDYGALQSDFDFEKNLALFDKQAIWDEIEAIQKPDLLPPSCSSKSKNYRHDENILTTKPLGLRQISTGYQCIQEFATDDDLVIPSIPLSMRLVIQRNAETMGLTRYYPLGKQKAIFVNKMRYIFSENDRLICWQEEQQNWQYCYWVVLGACFQ